MKTFMVGGAVRDKLLGRTPKDVDFVVVGATPEEMLAAGFQKVGADFPVFLNSDGVEYALARTERKSGKGYKGFDTCHDPNVTLEDDLCRRDLTINAMAMDDAGNLFDPFGGRVDMESKLLRHVSEAFADDPLRVLRLARFHARFGPEWRVAPSTMKLCRNLVSSGELKHLTRERVFKEWHSAMCEKHPELFFETLEACGALAVLFPVLATHKPSLSFGEDDPVELKFAKLLSHLRPNPAADVLRTWKAPKELVEFVKLYNTLVRLKDSKDHPVDSLLAVLAFRKPTLWLKVSPHVDNNFVKVMRYAFELTHKVSFFELNKLLQDTLTGPAVAEAIHQLRKETFDKCIQMKST